MLVRTLGKKGEGGKKQERRVEGVESEGRGEGEGPSNSATFRKAGARNLV